MLIVGSFMPVLGYTLALGVVVPLSGWLGLRLGQTRLYVMCMVGFSRNGKAAPGGEKIAVEL